MDRHVRDCQHPHIRPKPIQGPEGVLGFKEQVLAGDGELPTPYVFSSSVSGLARLELVIMQFSSFI